MGIGQDLQDAATAAAGASYGSLAEKILAAKGDAQAHEAIKGIKFQVRTEPEGSAATVIDLSQAVTVGSEEEAQTIVDALNKVIKPTLGEMAKTKEERIRSILGGHA
jgi:hypothetical protein